ncbi:MAG: FecR family protein, partial [Nitrospiraceae bacterium]
VGNEGWLMTHGSFERGVLTLIVVMAGSMGSFNAWAQPETTSGQIGFVIATKGTASLVSKFAMPRSAALRQEVYANDTIKTGLNSATKVLFDDQAVLSVSDNTEVAVTQYNPDLGAAKRTTILQVARGRVKAQVPEIYDRKDSRFEIRTPTAVASTQGADYVVWTDLQKGRVFTGVAVLTGTVEITNAAGQSMTVAPGFFSLASTDATISTPAPIQTDGRVQQLVQEADVKTDPTVAPQVKLAQQQAPAPVAGVEPDVGAAIATRIPGQNWVHYGGGGISRSMGTTNNACTFVSGSGNVPLGCTVHPLP